MNDHINSWYRQLEMPMRKGNPVATDNTPPGNEEIVSASPNPTPPHKKLSRKKVLALASTGTLVLVVGGGVWRAADQGVFSTGEGPAYEPWDALDALNDDPDVRVFWYSSADMRQQVGNLLVEAAQAFVADKAQDVVDTGIWYRATWQDIQQHRDGITIDAAGLPDLTRSIAKMLPPASQEQQESSFLQNSADQVKTAGAFGLLTVRNGQDRKQQLGAGRVWERMHLWVTKEGLAMQPLNQVVERAAREVVLGSTPHFGTSLQTLVGDPAWQTLLAFRVGYSTHEGLRSPRRAVNEVVKP
jgi:hypothetical protein